MNATMRLVMVGTFMGLLAGGIFTLRFACTPTDSREDIRNAQLDRMGRATFARLEARDQVVRALIAQRCTLAQAIERYLELDRQWPDITSKVLASQSQEERLYKNIRLRVKDLLHDSPEQASILLRRLDQEYEKLRTQRPISPAAEKEPTEPRAVNTK